MTHLGSKMSLKWNLKVIILVTQRKSGNSDFVETGSPLSPVQAGFWRPFFAPKNDSRKGAPQIDEKRPPKYFVSENGTKMVPKVTPKSGPADHIFPFFGALAPKAPQRAPKPPQRATPRAPRTPLTSNLS